MAKKRVGEAYRTAVLEERYDAVIIGSGMGGLSSAAVLAKQGKKVLVLERHYTAGGFTQTFTRPGYQWDVGIHYIGELDKENTLRRIFDYISEERLQWASMGEIYDRAVFPDTSYDFLAGEEAFRVRMGEYFPEQKTAIEQYVRMIKDTARSAATVLASRMLPAWLAKPAAPFLCRKFYSYSDRTLQEVLCSLTSDQNLMGVLATQWGDYGLIPSKASFAIHALVANHYLKGGYYPVGGAEQIAASIAPTIEKAGGKILVNAEVKEIVVRSQKAVAVRMQDGREIRSDTVISDAGVHNTMAMLPQLPQLETIRQKLGHEARRSASHVCLYVGLPLSHQQLGLQKTNLWIFPGYDHNANMQNYLADSQSDFPVVYISFPSAKDPVWVSRYPGKATIEIVSFAPYEWFRKWEKLPWHRRGMEYEKYKEELSQRLLDVLYKHVPQVNGKIGYYELSTPLSTRHFCNYVAGEIYGLEHTPERFRQTWLRPKLPIANAYFTGQDIVTDGIAGALLSGVLTASAVARRNLLPQILKG